MTIIIGGKTVNTGADVDTNTAVVVVYGADISQHTLFPEERVHGRVI